MKITDAVFIYMTSYEYRDIIVDVSQDNEKIRAYVSE